MGSETGPPLKFNLTGFKQFHNVPVNPTEIIVSELWKSKEKTLLPFGATLESATALDTAGIGASEHLLSLLDEAAGVMALEKTENVIQSSENLSGKCSEVVWVHLGVNSRATRFAVEQLAVNEATFRCPDEMGWQPDGLPIVAADGGISVTRQTKFDVEKIVDSMVKQGFDVAVSHDAGRFVCNYVYYLSLKHAADHGTKSLFIHVPPFTAIKEAIQLDFVRALLTLLATNTAS